ncbi:hypothetical protein NHX12_016685 [Muraenolepis orangiensis]|uniref:Laminin G domain-containing protein n=1 Tax=Muraenolepis orangiensis TaxID=630683 RepID=A0A9Q0D3X4_9TELE|nr:hypothetical protein NHX12_016685 [Muraenolepis orangiensis]
MTHMTRWNASPFDLFSSLRPPQKVFSLLLPLFNETLRSYAAVPWPKSSQSYLSFTEFEMTFRPSLADGTLLYSEDAQSADFIAVGLVAGHVVFRFDCGSGSAVIRYDTRKEI